MEANIKKITMVGWFLQTTYGNVEISVTKNCRISIHIVLPQVENTMNITPLTYLPEDNWDEHITPSHLMYGRNINRTTPLMAKTEL